MKKTITKIWGIGLVVVLIASLMIFAAPVSAGTNSISALSGSSAPSASNTNPVMVDLAINGSTLYGLFSDGKVYKSTNGGTSWTATSSAVHTNATKIAVAPDSASVLVTANATGLNLSSNAGVTWDTISPVASLTKSVSAISDVAIAPMRGIVRNITVCGIDNSTNGNIWLFDLGNTLPGWTSLEAKPGYNTAMDVVATIAYSPYYLSDLTLMAVTANLTNAATDTITLSAYTFGGNGAWNTSTSYIGVYPLTLSTSAGLTGVSASMVLDPVFQGYSEETRNAFVAISATTGNDANAAVGLYRGVNDVKTKISTVAMYSVDYNGSSLVAGAAGAATVYRSSSPLVGSTGGLLANATMKGPGGASNVTVAYVGTNVLAATQGANSAVAISKTGGQYFNDVSMIKATLTTTDELVMTPTAGEMYLTTTGAGIVSVWHKTTAWERVLSMADGGAEWIIGMAPEATGTLYIAKQGDSLMYYTTDAGAGRWYPRNCTVIIQDIAVESASTVYALCADGTVVKTTFAGFDWSPTPIVTGLGATAYSLNLVSTGVVLAGGNGLVAITVNGGTSWVKGTITSASGAVACADENFATNNTIYAGGSGTTKVWKGVVGATSITMTDLALTPPATHTGIYGVASKGGVVYALSANTTASAINQYVETTWQAVASTSPYGIGTFMSNGLILAGTGNNMYMAKSATVGLASFTDVIGVTIPALSAPAAGASYPSANDVIFTIPALTGATSYTLELAYDSSFNQMVLTPVTLTPATPTSTALNAILGPNQGTGFKVIWMPGTTYYWRTRALTPLGSPYSSARSFTIQAGLALVPVIGSPANGATGVSTSPAFSWSPVAGATMYEFQLSTAPTFASLSASGETSFTGFAPTVTLTAGGTYFWRVRATLPIVGDWSSVANFTAAVPTPPTQATTTTTTTLPAVTTTIAPTTTTQTTVVITQTSVPAPTLTVSIPAQPQPTTVTFTIPAPEQPAEIAPTYIWAIIIIGAVLVIAVIVLIVRTRRSV